MSNKTLDTPKTRGKGYVAISGSFAPNGSSALVATSTYGAGFSVAYTSTGLYTITFEDTYKTLVSATATVQLASGDDKFLQFGAYNATAKTLTIRCWDISDAAVADIAANANNRINFHVVFKNVAAFK